MFCKHILSNSFSRTINEVFIPSVGKEIEYVWAGALVQWLLEETHVLKLWVQILAPDTGWTRYFFTLICCKICIVCLKKTENKQKEAEDGPLKKRD